MRTLLAVLVLVAAAAGCDHRPEDFTRIRAQVSAFHDTWSRRIAELEVRHARLVDRLAPVPPGTEGLAEVGAQLTDLKTRLVAFGDRADALRGGITTEIQARKRRVAETSVARGNSELQVEHDAILAALDQVSAAVDVVETRAAAAKQAADDAAKVAATGPDLLAPAFARTAGSSAELPIVFKPGETALDIEASAVALDNLVKLAQACPTVKLKLTAHVSPTADAAAGTDALSQAQAEALGRYLQGRGVAPTAFEVAGGGGSQPLAPEVGTPEAQATAIARNRRVTVTVATPCPSTT